MIDMIEQTCGSKRRRSDADENERITLRQMVFNMSICKLHKDQGRKEPSLLRSVVITNTVRYIENEMDEEMLDDYYYSYKPDHVQENISKDISNTMKPELDEINNSNIEEISLYSKAEEDNIILESSKFGAIGDRRKNTEKEEKIASNKSPLSGFLWDSLSLPAVNTFTPALENVELETNFPDVDIALYDFDNSSTIQMQTPNDWRVYPTSCAMEFECRKPDAFFEELDQIMQVLVGM